MIKVAFNSLCVGVGGADAFMIGLANSLRHVDVTGISVYNDTHATQHEWVKYGNKNLIPFFQRRYCPDDNADNFTYSDGHTAQIDAACKDADIVVSWGLENGEHVKRRLGKCFIDFAQNGDKFFQKVCTINNPFTDFRVACSHFAALAFPEQSRSKVRVIYNGIDPSRVSPQFGREATRKQYGFTDKKVLLFLGRFVPEKNPEIVIEALGRLPDDFVAVFCGHGELQPKLESEAARYAPGRVFFMQPQYHVGDILAMADVYVLPTDYEGHPLAWCEAVLAGTPTVVTDIAAMKELVTLYGPLASYVPRRPTVEQLIHGIDFALSKAFHPIGSRARNICWNNWTLSTITAQWEEFLQEAFSVYNYHKRHPKTKQILGQSHTETNSLEPLPNECNSRASS